MSQQWRRFITADLGKVDYPWAFWSSARNFYRYPPPRPVEYVIIHITGGPSMDEHGALQQFRNGPSSAHYIVNREGSILQMVREAHVANHVKALHSYANYHSIGIEHVNPWNEDDQLHPTDEQYNASARLVSHLCRKYSIPVVHSTVPRTPGIRGHKEEQPDSGHVTCPNPAWDWPRYIELVRATPVETFEDIVRSVAAGR